MVSHKKSPTRLTILTIMIVFFVSAMFSNLDLSSNPNGNNVPLVEENIGVQELDPQYMEGVGTNLPVTLFCEKTYQISDFKIENSKDSADRENVYVVPSLPGYEIYKVNITLGSEELTALRDYQFATTDTSEYATIEKQTGGFEVEAAGQEFSIPYRSQIYNTSIYMAIAGLYSDNNGTAEFRDSSPNGNLIQSQIIPVNSLGFDIWHVYSWSLILNDTSHSYEFMLNGTQIGASGRQYYWYHPSTTGITQKGDVKLYALGWTNTQYDFTFKLCYLPLNDTGSAPRNFTAPETSLQINGTDIGADNTIEIEQVLTALQFTTNISAIINDIAIRVFYRKTTEETTITNYEVAADDTFVKWNASKTLTFPSNTVNRGMNFSIPLDWEVNAVLNATDSPLVGFSNWVNVSEDTRIVILQDISNGTWLLNCSAPNYLVSVSFEKKLMTSYELQSENETLLITDTIRINGTVRDGLSNPISSGYGNLTVFFSNTTSCYSENNTAPSTQGGLNFSDWTISDSTHENNTYTVQIRWYNGTEAGLIITYFHVIYPTNQTCYIDSLKYTTHSVLDRNIGDKINVTSLYNNTFTPRAGGISTTDAFYRIENASAGLWVDWTSLDLENLGVGYYNNTFDTTQWTEGTYYILLEFNKTGYLSQSENITINLEKRPTALTTYLNSEASNFLSIYSNQTVNITAFFEDIHANIGLPNAEINLLVQYNNTLYPMQDDGAGNYSWLFDGWEWGEKVTLPYNFSLTLNGTRWDADYNETMCMIQILNYDPVILTQATNQTGNMYRNQTIWANATVTDLEDVFPDLTVYLCVYLVEEAQWNNNSMTVNGNFFEYNFTIPRTDEYLGQLDVYIRANDTDDGWLEVALGTVTVKNILQT
ncbi:MAG: hypothetical protein ACTSQI_19680 [Candidatus Helarchaeota archaeon]